MKSYIDGYAFPIQNKHLDAYKNIVVKIAEIWKEHGAISYTECRGENLDMEGTVSFAQCLGASPDETIIFGWIEFESKEVRDRVHKLVASDKKMNDLIKPIMNPSNLIFNASRMAFGGFQSMIKL